MYYGEKMSAMIGDALTRKSLGEEIDYDFGVTFMPTQQGMMPAYAITLLAPTILIGQYATFVGAVPNLRPGQEEIDNVVAEGLRQIADQKAKHAQVINGNGSRD